MRSFLFGPRWLLVILALVSLHCDPGTQSPERAAGNSIAKTVVLVSIDTWRRDANGFLGGLDPSPTPFLDRLAEKGIVATDAMTPVPFTAPSHWSMLSGRWPWRDGVRVNGVPVTRSEHKQTLPEILSEHGWLTAAFVSCGVLGKRFGFSAGFEHFDDQFHVVGDVRTVDMAERRGDRTIDAALTWLGKYASDQKVFLWIHLFDPHFPYAAPQGPLPGEHGDYLAEVAFADHQLERLAGELERLGRPFNEALWIVIADHGEALGEHHELSHGLLLHGATTRIPLLIVGESVQPGRFETLASTVDILPTVLGYLGLDVPESDGTDLLHARGEPDRSIPLESMMGAKSFGLAAAIGLRHENWLWEASPVDHLWDLRIDPREENDLAQSALARVAELRARRTQFHIPELDAPVMLDQETVMQLRALGYLSSANRTGTGDVREFSREGLAWFNQLETNIRKENFNQAEFFAKKCMDRYPNSVDLWVNAGFVAVSLGNDHEAEVRFRQAVRLNPDYLPARLNFANILFKTGRLNEAEAEYRHVLEQDPNNLFALSNLGDLLIRRGRTDEAVPFLRRFCELYPTHPRAAIIRKLIEDGSSPKTK